MLDRIARFTPRAAFVLTTVCLFGLTGCNDEKFQTSFGNSQGTASNSDVPRRETPESSAISEREGKPAPISFKEEKRPTEAMVETSVSLTESNEDGDSDFSVPQNLRDTIPHLKTDAFGTNDYAGYLQDQIDWGNELSAIALEHARQKHRRWCSGYIEYLKAQGRMMDWMSRLNRDDARFYRDMNLLGLSNHPQ